ncbi:MULTISPECIES: GNAT family N-acetyltransferase [Shewanella]|uniref:GNAT family N-acetyltransferase n=1 Tax=Shewanella marisflavi TaxID=260364 RepID=A0ABX5WH12_9GAMM|nr:MULTISPECIES: GNAT family N-acetyltransferase [Shewanella]QDF73697.1 GNAT family N-acetyltransferase [Shewanella marisflavi]
MKIIKLIEQPEAIDQLGYWYHNEWGHLGSNRTQSEQVHSLGQYLQYQGIPQLWLAQDEHQPIGAIQLRYQENSNYPSDSVWLGGIYVVEQHRGKGVATKLVREAQDYAASLNVKTLYLQTEAKNLALYHNLGWQIVATLSYCDLTINVMAKNL